jgi:hypothetical protein
MCPFGIVIKLGRNPVQLKCGCSAAEGSLTNSRSGNCALNFSEVVGAIVEAILNACEDLDVKYQVLLMKGLLKRKTAIQILI